MSKGRYLMYGIDNNNKMKFIDDDDDDWMKKSFHVEMIDDDDQFCLYINQLVEFEIHPFL